MVLPTSFMLHVTWKISCRSPSWPSRLLQESSCKCLKVMSGKPVARDPEGERQRAST